MLLQAPAGTCRHLQAPETPPSSPPPTHIALLKKMLFSNCICLITFCFRLSVHFVLFAFKKHFVTVSNVATIMFVIITIIPDKFTAYIFSTFKKAGICTEY